MPSLFRVALPALAAAGSAYAASCTISATTTIQNAGDATGLSSCSTFSGSIAIATGTSDDIALDGIKVIKGDVLLQGATKIRRFGGANLESISGKLDIDNVPELASLTLPKLTAVSGLTLKGLPNLRSLGFDSQISKCDHLDVENTKLQDLNGLNLTTVADIFIANNNEIGNISMQVTNITDRLTISFNNPEMAVSFPHLVSANNISLRAIGSLSIPALAKINKGDFGIFESDNLESVSAPNLTKIDGALVIDNNKNLKNLTFDSLTDVGANLQIANNTQLHDLTGLPQLAQVAAALDMSGNFSKVSTPKLNFVKGVFNLQSTGDIGTVCADFYDPMKDKGKLPKGNYVCKGKLNEANTAGKGPGSSSGSGSGGSSSGGDKKGAAGALAVPSMVLGAAGIFAVMFL